MTVEGLTAEERDKITSVSREERGKNRFHLASDIYWTRTMCGIIMHGIMLNGAMSNA